MRGWLVLRENGVKSDFIATPVLHHVARSGCASVHPQATLHLCRYNLEVHCNLPAKSAVCKWSGVVFRIYLTQHRTANGEE